MDCPHIPEIRYGDFSERLHDKVGSQRIPICGSIEVTARCNLNCRHCYINLPRDDKEAQKSELNYAEWCRIIDQVVTEGCLWLLLTGGEPLIRPDFWDIYTYAKQQGLIITLFTNGTLISSWVADLLADWRPFAVEITIYGRTRKTHEAVTRVPGSYHRCLRGIHMLLNRQIPVKLKTMVMTLNHHELGEMQSWADELGVEFRFDPLLNPRLDGSREPCRLRLPPEKVVELDLADAKRLKEWQEFIEKFWGAPPADRLYICGAGINTFHIDPNGKLSVCMMSREPGYDLQQGSFRDGWYDNLLQVLQKKPHHEYRCRTCELISLCGQCPGWAQMENGDQQTPVEYLCRVAHLRAEALGCTTARKRKESGI